MPDDTIWEEFEGNHRLKVVAFYNIFAEGNHFRDILNDQVNRLKETGLVDKLDMIYYTTMGSQGSTLNLPGEKFKHIKHFSGDAYEVDTLSILYGFCNRNPGSKVLYFHDKGSYHYNGENIVLRPGLLRH